MRRTLSISIFVFVQLWSVKVFSSPLDACNLNSSQLDSLRNASFYYKSERYLEAEIELNRILQVKKCDSIRIFHAFTYLRQSKNIDILLIESDWKDIRFRILYDFSNLARSGRDFAEVPKENTYCLYPDCRLEGLESILVYLIQIKDWENLDSSSFENTSHIHSEEELKRFREYWTSEQKKIQEKSKSPYLAGGFSAAIPGTGQIYADQFAEGVTSFFVNLVVLSATYALYVAEPTSVLFYLVSGVSLVTYTTNIIGGFSAANRNNNYWKYETLEGLKKEFISLPILEKEILFKLF
ncbi:hypothetical protein CH352_06785 [Leptospira hartskeerlii]|uniref:Tetratricopeptide repeat protein n=1 Tax=Leptospira hartskeerlii TaxID=2023177 RepID=A0A2M9XF60_9LEPT|nr:hypothetical protein [Leptospira hartskeerlii]PJZ26274.1 hypothetical protein CH357_07190 [Leptospira hartskeerlii]PJZ34358.1 hypothetical protein CH352_06785 [Leptospira hartskeerlii]